MSDVTDVIEPAAVFVDSTGRRRRVIRNTGILVGCALTIYLMVVAFSLATDARVPTTPWPDAKHSRHGGLPGHARPSLHPTSARATKASSDSSGTVPAHTSTPTHHATPAHPVTTRSTRPGNGRAYGLTKRSRPGKP